MATAEKAPRFRTDFSRIRTKVKIPNLIEVQKRSYERFLQMYTAPEDREDIGLQAVFKSIFPIEDFRETCSLEFVELLDRHVGSKATCCRGSTTCGRTAAPATSRSSCARPRAPRSPARTAGR